MTSNYSDKQHVAIAKKQVAITDTKLSNNSLLEYQINIKNV
ncbi:hypothetical protein UAY_00895 [Enterococcus moraviensis ATCC BAA-383]|uniref:Uncharacterized protein n=1 Tax=Enterococcus moraviensis ATCC BAA-383 TaxID=1158609 RepID=R2R2C2_9ENTE|nr:hypothetical protein UAY_00895 [Enterococcus moraviensis ATCC BAA-383]EOT73975.1 hypothetical protein I586_00971 [Enterococcus moraviensis ATCC BAA-383]